MTPGPNRSTATLALLAFAMLIVSLDQYIVVVALPDIGRDLGYSSQTLQSVISAYAVIFGYAQQVVTRLVDRQAGNVQGPARSRNDPAKPPTIDPGTTTALQEQGEE